MNIHAVLMRSESVAFFSFLIGVGFAIMMFHRPVVTERLLALSPSELEGKTVKANGNCYLYRVEDASCEFADS